MLSSCWGWPRDGPRSCDLILVCENVIGQLSMMSMLVCENLIGQGGKLPTEHAWHAYLFLTQHMFMFLLTHCVLVISEHLPSQCLRKWGRDTVEGI